jgi:hypothetical protein
MNLGQKSQFVTSSLGVKNSRPSLSVGVKQNHNPHVEFGALTRNNTSDGIIRNESNSNDIHYQPIKGIQLPSHKSNINLSRNNIEKAHKIKRSSENNHFT